MSIYRDEREGGPLWQETQNVSVDSECRYSVLLGATLNDGLLLELLTSGEPRWLGVRFNRPSEVEQPRTLLTSVPYALRASDAETLGGLPASAFLRDPSASSSSPTVTAAAAANLTPNAPQPRVSPGVTGYIPMFTAAATLTDSSLHQYGTRIGLNTTLPYDYMHVVFSDSSGQFTGYAVQNVNAAGFSGMLFYDQTGALAEFQGFGTTHEYRINNIASNGTINFLIGSNSKFQVLNSGDIDVNGNLRYGETVVLQLGQLWQNSLGLGTSALASNTTGCCNTDTGAYALDDNTTGNGNTAAGNSALGLNTTGGFNTAIGYLALFNSTLGSYNMASGSAALYNNSTGTDNTATGGYALWSNSTGASDTAIRFGALQYNTTGSNNVALGNLAANNVPSGNSNNIHIGTEGSSADNGAIRIGGNTALGDPANQTSFFASGIRGVTTGMNNAVPVLIDSNGQLGTVSSSRRFKEDIQDMGEASRGLMQLRPVTFRYQKSFADGSKPLQYGLIAEEVAEVYPIWSPAPPTARSKP